MSGIIVYAVCLMLPQFQRFWMLILLLCLLLAGCGGGGGGGEVKPAPPPPPVVEPPPEPPDWASRIAEEDSSWCAGVLLSVTNYSDPESEWNFRPVVAWMMPPNGNTQVAMELWYYDKEFMWRERDRCFEIIGFIPKWDTRRRFDPRVNSKRWNGRVQPTWVEELDYAE